MRYPFSKEQYLSVQDKLYDEFENILRKKNISNIEYKLVERDLFYTPDKEIIRNRKYTTNINSWLEEIGWLKGNILEELLLCLGYNQIYDKFISPLSGSLKYVNRERYLRLLVYDLFTFREKLSFLIYEMFNRKIKIPIKKRVCINNKVEIKQELKELNKNQVSFDKIIKGLEVLDISKENIIWISKDEFKLIVSIMHEFNDNKHIKNLKDIRHAFTHRSNPGIDCLALRSFEYSKPDSITQKMLLQYDKSLGIKEPQKLQYVIKSSKPLEKETCFEDIISDVLAVWQLFTVKFKFLLENVSILRNEIECFY